ncbi:MAG: bifunctional methylenetetrahydrofolate dehydrogenase/methenyltetrahydrofolate cyclohydrolase FolD [Deltaproteobacteria bacterium]|nr:bifunctional methylenetetrahydrofolate dehydrogenase/methenyltetrahydrofolate cyclohydrolase FolD [Deltaproteobacteria bacterium]
MTKAPTDSSSTAVVVDGKAIADDIRSHIADEVSALVESGHRPPHLTVVIVGDDPASLSYIKGKQRACKRVGFTSAEEHLSADTDMETLLSLLHDLNEDDGVDGILVQLPLPKGLSANAVALAIDPAKDVDGLHPVNAGRLMAGQPGLYACTPLGIMEVLDRHKVNLEGAQAVVIGRSNIVGKPISMLLQQRHATVTMCHSRTRDIAALCREADVIVAATGVARMVKADWVRPGAAVIDVGVSVIDGKLVGDIDLEGVSTVASLVTPPRGGVGPLTITMLLKNTLQAYRDRKGLL